MANQQYPETLQANINECQVKDSLKRMGVIAVTARAL